MIIYYLCLQKEMNEYHAPHRAGYTVEQCNHLEDMIAERQRIKDLESPASVVLVGGTNGKTTTTKMLFHIRSCLDPGLFQLRMASDIDLGYDENVIHELFRLWRNNVHLVVEAWSLGWKLFRYDTVLCEYPKEKVVSLITNITQDHGNDHGYDMDVYAATKFRTVEFSRLVVIHESLIPYYKKYGQHVPVLVFGFSETCDVVIHEDSFTYRKWLYRFEFDRPQDLFGDHNRLNIVGACILAMEPWITSNNQEMAMQQWPMIRSAIQSFEKVPGRLERYTTLCKQILCISDFAHNPDGMQAVLEAVRPLVPPTKSLWCIFGCNELKDTKKQPMMGHAAFTLADKVVITTDHECVMHGFQEVVEGIVQGNDTAKLVCTMEDRVQAIRKTLDMADEHDVVLICNMGTDLYTCTAWDQDQKMTQPSVVSIQIAGDIIPHPTAPLDFPDPSQCIMSLCNFEGTISPKKEFVSGYPYFAAPLSWASVISKRYNVIGLANNHCLDYGKEGLAHTASMFRQAGALVVGDTKSYSLFVHPETAVRVGIFCYTEMCNSPCSWAIANHYQLKILFDKRNFKVDYGDADIYVAYLHWGDEFSDGVSDQQLLIKEELEKYGFDVVVGCHAHVAQTVHMVGQTCIFGVGNVVSDHATTRYRPRTDPGQGLIVQYDFIKDHVTKTTVLTAITSFSNQSPGTKISWPVSIPTEQLELPLNNNTSIWLELDMRVPCAHHFLSLLRQGYYIDTTITYGTAEYDMGGAFMGYDSGDRFEVKERWDPPLKGIGFVEHDNHVGAWFMLHYNRGRNLSTKIVHWFGKILSESKLKEGLVVVATYPVTEKQNQGPMTYSRLERITHGEWWKRPLCMDGYGGISFDGTNKRKVWVCEHPKEIMNHPDRDGWEGILIVRDRIAALRAAARDCSLRFQGPIIRITGSSGKTTTRCITAHLLEAKYHPHEILSNAMNYNNTIGVPQTVLEMTPDTKIMVIEMGISEPDEMALMTATVHGTVSVLLNVQHAHEANFSSHDHLVQEKMLIQRNNAGIFLDYFHNPLFKENSYGLTPGRAKALAVALDICKHVQVYPAPEHIGTTISIMDALIPDGRAHVSFQHELWVLDDTYNGNPHSIANMIDICASHPYFVVIVLAEVAECPPEHVTRIVGDALQKIAHRKDVFLYLGGEMWNWVPHLQNTYRFAFEESIPHICSNLPPQAMLAIKGTGLFKKDPRWKMWEWLETCVLAKQVMNLIHSYWCPIARQNMKALLLDPLLRHDYHTLQRNLMDPSVMMFENRVTDPFYLMAKEIVECIKKK